LAVNHATPGARIKPPPGAQVSITYLQYASICFGIPVASIEAGTLPATQAQLAIFSYSKKFTLNF
jgi:hypothetical protein